ncbi:unnamed protein product, partial [Acidocella sp. C78]
VPHDIGEQIDGIPSLNHMLEAWVRDYGSRPPSSAPARR